jgi:anti-sigma factor (TIGR02949 family)
MRCAEVARVLQHYLDGQADELTTRRVRRHLEACRRCGLEADTYRAIKDALARRRSAIDPRSVERLRAFAADLAARGPERAAPGDTEAPA